MRISYLHRGAGLGALAVTLALSAGVTSAQTLAFAGSESYVAEAPSISGSAGYLTSTSFRATSSIEAVTCPATESTSLNYRALGGAGLFGAWASSAPIVFGVSGGLGSKDGGEAVTIFGRGFTEPGAGVANLDLAGAPLSGVSVSSNTTLTALTPAGVNPYGNPLALVDLDLTNQLGNSSARDAFAFGPSLIADTLPANGDDLVVSLHSAPGTVVVIAVGGPIPGFAIPMLQLDGALEVILNMTLVTPIMPSTGHTQVVLPIPSDPGLIGITANLQAAAIDNLVLLSGSFTNMLPIPIQ